MSETWKAIDGWPYEVSDLGRVRRTERGGGRGSWPAGRPLRPRPHNKGYLHLTLYCGAAQRQREVLLHVLVAEHFLGPCPDGYEVNHKDGVKPNCRADNLEYQTRGENNEHARMNGLNRNFCETHCFAKLTNADVIEIRRRRSSGERIKPLAVEFGVSQARISEIANFKAWRRLAA